MRSDGLAMEADGDVLCRATPTPDTNWAVALQDIYGGDDAASRLRSLAKTNTSKVNL